MANTPWTVQKSKRKQSTTTPTSRKRVRISDDVGESKARGSGPKGQKTLTQIQWVKNPDTSFDGDDPDFQEIQMEQEESTRPAKRRTPALKKRDSTLTQMDWFDIHQDDTMDGIEMLPEEKVSASTAPLPQLDGACDSPRKQKKRKSNVPQTSLRSSSPTSPERETQNYRPTVRSRDKFKAPAGRRRSSRIASKVLTDPEENFEYMNDALLPSAEQVDKQRSPQRRPVLEIEESVDLGVVYLPPQVPRPPETPRHHYEIRSSQTPETLTRTRRKIRKESEKSPCKTVRRVPLAEKPVNTILNAHSQGPTKLKSPLKSGKPSPKRTRICVLKVPSRELLKKTARIEDSQRDIYSLQGTSSASDSSRHSDGMKPLELPITHKVPTQQAIEIPPTSQDQDNSDHEIPSSPPLVETDDSLPELRDLLPSRRPDVALVNQKKSSEASTDGSLHGDNSIIVRDFGRPRSQEIDTSTDLSNERRDYPKPVTGDEMLLDKGVIAPRHSEPVQNVSTAPEEVVDDDFGSPIANDTQFNFGLSDRTSSPGLPPMVDASKGQSRHASIDEHTTPTRSHHSGAASKTNEIIHPDTETPIPTPRLIQRPGISSFLTQPTQILMDKENAMLPPPFHLNHPLSATKVPLNDVSHVSSSSSPLLPPVKSTTQRSVHPASMPRPSQMSTQEPTQIDFLSSSMPNLTQHQTQTDGITIKDSDSVHLSQIPQHISQGQGPNLRPINDSDDDSDDLNPDPSSIVQRVQSARKPFALSRTGTGSSLRSIHPPSDPLHNQRLDLTSSSSSPLPPPATTSHRLGRIGPPSTTRPSTNQLPQAKTTTNNHNLLYDSDATTSSPISSPNPSPLKKKYDPIPGFDNETQSDFTQNGHITAAFIHRQREQGAMPDWYTPEPMQIAGAARMSAKRKRT